VQTALALSAGTRGVNESFAGALSRVVRVNPNPNTHNKTSSNYCVYMYTNIQTNRPAVFKSLLKLVGRMQMLQAQTASQVHTTGPAGATSIVIVLVIV